MRRKGEGSPHVDLIAKEGVGRVGRCGKFASCIGNSEIFSNFLLELEVFTYSSYYCNYKLAVITRKTCRIWKILVEITCGKVLMGGIFVTVLVSFALFQSSPTINPN